MEKKFKHRKTGEIITYKDGVIKSGTFVLDMGCEPSSEYWEEITEYPIGTKVKDILNNIERIKEPQGWRLKTHIKFTNIDESEIGEGKRFQVIEEPKKDYEILSYKQNISNRLYKKDFNDNFIADNGWSLSKPIDKHGNISIHSVRRLSDNFVITLGDYCKTKKGSSGKVTTIEFCGNGELRIGSDKRYYVGINDVVKSEVLFRTKDDVEIVEGDKVYGVSINWNVFSGVVQKDNRYHREEWKHGKFSTEEAADEYRILNYPCLSIKDVQSIYVSAREGYKKNGNEAEYFDKLKQLVKSKL